MKQKNIFLMMTLSLSLVMMMSVSMLFSLEDTTVLRAEIISSQKFLTPRTLSKLADNKYADGNVPLGDKKYVTDAPKKGFVYLCNARSNSDQGAGTDGPWIDTKKSVWNFLTKISISGSVKWAQAKFSNTSTPSTSSGPSATRTLSGNNLPIDHNTGTFPVAKTDVAYAYDRNPNTIKAQTEKKYELPLNPIYSETPYCMSGGEVGIMLSGVSLFNAFDAQLRDAPAHELQDDCDGHPQEQGVYHYHSMSSCFKNISASTVLGFAFDGFPITGPKIGDKYLTTEDLDECHGITSTIMLDGKKTNSYHYVLTQDFPYSVSCYRGKPISYGTTQNNNQMKPTTGASTNTRQPPTTGTPPTEAVSACNNKTPSSSCSFTTPDGKSITGVCNPTQLNVVACVPS